MIMDEKIYQCKELNSSEKIVINYLLKGHNRIKYISYDIIANQTHVSKTAVFRIIKKFVAGGLLIQKKPLSKSYYFTIFTNEIFYKYCDDLYVNENGIKIKDDEIRMICLNLQNNFTDPDIEKARDLFDRLYDK